MPRSTRSADRAAATGRLSLNRHPELPWRRIANHALLDVQRADSRLSVGNLNFLVAMGAFGLLLLAEDEHKTLHLNLLTSKLGSPRCPQGLLLGSASALR
jgi:hypothetical protein